MRVTRSFCLLAVVLASMAFGILSACSDATGPGPVEPITELPRELSQVEVTLLEGSNAFAFDLAAKLLPNDPDANVFFSPLSASMMLGMLMNGADGTTWTEMRDMLGHDGLTEEEINRGYADLTSLLLGLDRSVTTEIGNSVWSDTGFPVLPDFEERVGEHFDAATREVDLQGAEGLAAINGWARDATNGRIEEMFSELPAQAVMVLLNAIYFKADWTTRFPRGDTRRAPFTRADGTEVDVDLMSLSTDLPVTGTDEALLVDLPYGGGAFAMTVVVPRDDVGLDDLVSGLTADRWNGWTDGLRESKAEVELPRMEIEWEAELNDTLQALGMPSAFSPSAADFSRLTPGGGVWLGLVKQKAWVRVDEAGTEAAAVTGGVLFDSGPFTISADRPFLFVLRERLTGTIMFMGIVNDPST